MRALRRASVLEPGPWAEANGHELVALARASAFAAHIPGWSEEIRYRTPTPYLVRARDATVLGDPMAPLCGDTLLLDGMLACSRAAVGMSACIDRVIDDTAVVVDVPVEPLRIAGSAVLLGGGDNFSHNLLDWASRIGPLVSLRPELRGLPLIVSSTLSARGLEIFHRLGLWEGRLIRVPPDGAVRVDELWAVSLTHVYQTMDPRHVAYVRARLGVPRRAPSRGGRRLFLTREASRYRRLLNEAAVRAHLGFETVDPARLDFDDQLRLFGEAECIVSPLGGASAACVLAPEDCGLVDLTHEHMRLLQYAILCRIIGQPYRQIVGRSESVSTTGMIFDRDFTVAPDAVAAAVAAVTAERGESRSSASPGP